MEKLRNASELEELKEAIVKKNSQFRMTVALCGGPGCLALGSETLKNAFESELRKNNLDDKIRVIFSGCQGFCEQGPLVIINPEGILYCKVKEKDVASIVSDTLIKGEVIESLLYEDPATGEKITYEREIPFYKAQERALLGQN